MKSVLLLGLLTIITIGITAVPAYAASPGSPLDQFNSGVPLHMIQCSDDKLLMKSPAGKPLCIASVSGDKLSDRGYSFVTFMDDEIKITATENDTQQERDDYLNSLQFGLVGEGEFKGELYGHDQNIHIRQPAPAPYSLYFSQEHYEMSEDGLVGKSNLNDVISIPSKGATGSSGDAIIDYREWLPTWIGPGYYLKWIDITQAEDQISSTQEGIAHIVFTYVPKGVEIPVDINNKEFSDLSMYVINVRISNEPIVHMSSQSQIDEYTHNGTDTDIVFEDRWDGYIKYVHASRSDPAKHGVAYHSPYVGIGSGGSALTMEEHENIVIELFERYDAS